jgi:hypothetical protein
MGMDAPEVRTMPLRSIRHQGQVYLVIPIPVVVRIVVWDFDYVGIWPWCLACCFRSSCWWRKQMPCSHSCSHSLWSALMGTFLPFLLLCHCPGVFLLTFQEFSF